MRLDAPGDTIKDFGMINVFASDIGNSNEYETPYTGQAGLLAKTLTNKRVSVVDRSKF
jgi:hypothetical protein